MKKKLIAAITSVAMVATMVPAVAFAGTDAAGASPTAKTKAAQKAASYNTYEEIEAAVNAYTDDPADTDNFTATYIKKADYDALQKAIDEKLSPGERAEIKALANYKNFEKGKNAIDDMDGLIQVAKDLIGRIPHSISASDTTIGAAREAYDAVEDLETAGGINKLGEDILGGEYKAVDFVGEPNLKALKNAEAIKKTVDEIGKMDLVSDTNYTNYATEATVQAATDAYEKLGADKNRVGNKAAYDAKMQAAEDTKAAKAAMDKVQTDILDAKTPYDQKKLTAAKAALDAAIKAVKAIKALPATVADVDTANSGLKWDAIIDDGGHDKYTAGTAHDMIETMETAVENDAAVKPVVDAINGLGKVEDLRWSTANKDKVFAVTYAYGQLSGANSSDTGSQKEFLKDNYQAADEAYKALIKNDGWIKQEGQNLAAAINWMTAKIDAIPGTITLASKAAIDEAKKAYDEYDPDAKPIAGYLSSLSVKAGLPPASTRKLSDALKKLGELEADKKKADKAAAKPFLDLMGDKGTATTLWGKAITADALKISDKALVQEARAAYDKLTDDQKALTAADDCDVVEAYKALQKAEQTIAELEGKGDADTIANGLMVAIRALPAKDKLTLANKDAVYALNDQYLAAIEKNAGVKKILGDAKVDETLFAAVGTIMDLEIAELPILKADGTETKAAIDEAAAKIDAVKARYDKIGKEQQAEVLKTSALDSAVSQLSKAQVKYAENALEAALKIDATKELSKEDAAAIKLAKEAIDALSKTQAAGLDQAKVKALDETLLPALEAYEKSIKALENATISISAQTYTGSDLTPAVKVTDKAGNVVAGKNYRVVFDDNREVGTATATIIAISGSDYTGSKDATFAIGQASIAKASVGGVTDKTYTGRQIKPTVKVVVSGRTLKNGTDYTVSYGKNTSLGKGSVKITAKGNYAGTIGKTFKIKPAKETISSLKAGKKKFTVKFKKQSGATNYQIHYDAKGVKAKTVRTTKTTKTVTKLKKGKKYVVKVRAYKKIDGKPFYGAYSNKKTVKVK